MNINPLVNLFRLSRALGKGSRSLLATTQRRSKDFLVTTITESFYLAMYFTFVAFLVGLTASLKWRYKDQLMSGFIRNNLPAVGNPSNEITWETFEHIGSKQLSLKHLASQAWESQQSGEAISLLVESPLVERIDVYNDLFVIKPKAPWEKLRSQKYIGFYISSPDPQKEATFDARLATTDVSHLSLESRVELADQLGPCSALASSGWLDIPARGFVEFPRVGSLCTSSLRNAPPLPQALDLSAPLLVRADAQEDPGAAELPSRGCKTASSQPLAYPLATASVFAGPADLPETFSVGSYPLTSKPTLLAAIDDNNRVVAAGGHSPSPSKGLIKAWDSPESKGRVSGWSPLRKWGYQFYAYLDEMPYKLGATKLSSDDLAVIESARSLSNAISREKHPTGPHLADWEREDKLGRPLRGDDMRAEELGDPFEELQATRNRLNPSPLLGPNSNGNSNGSQHHLPARQDPPQARTTSISFKVASAKSSRNGMQGVGQYHTSGLIGVKVMDAFNATHLPRSLEEGTLGLERAAPHTMLPSPRSQREVGSSHAAYPANKTAPQTVGALSMKRQAFAKEAALVFGSDGLLWRNSPSWAVAPRLLNELNTTEAMASIEEGIKALEEGWEEWLALLNDSVSHLLAPIRPVPTRLMSGYSYPDSTRTELMRDLSHWVIRYRFNLGEAASGLLLAEREVPLPASPSLPLPSSGTPGPSNGKRQVGRLMPQIPMAEIDYLPVSLSGLTSLQSVLDGLDVDALEGALDEIPMLEPAYQGPAVARDKATNDLAGRGRGELTAWVARALLGYEGGARSGALSDLETALSSRQGNRLGKKEVLRGEPLMREKLLAGVRLRTGLDLGVLSDTTEEARTGVDSASRFMPPVKSNKMAPESFLAGLGPKLKDPSQVLALESGDEAPLYPLEIVLTKAAPLFEEAEEVLSLEADEWQNIFKGVVVQAIENKGSLDKIEVLLPSIAVAHKCPGKEAGAVNQAGLNEAGGSGLSRTRLGELDGRLQRGHLDDRYDRHPGQQQREFGKAYELTRVLTSQEYTNLGILVAQSKRFVGECGYWPINDSRAAEVDVASTPRLLCHYLPLSRVAIPESSTKQPISAGNYQKRLTSFTAHHPFNSQWRSASPPERAVGSFPVVRSKQQMFYQLWEPVTANSWMMFYKLCFAFWIQEMGKDFYQRYGKEIILYALNLLVALGFDAQGMIEDLGLEESSMRVITNGARRFGDIAGIDSILPELGEIVWFLRSSGRGGQVPKGILLVGPPGTGKTFLVQAIAGEARVPVIVQSASSLRDSGQKQSGSQKLRDLFDRARQLSPCILFMDEIDTLGVSRPHVIGNTMGADELLESIEGGGSRQEDATNLTGTGRELNEQNDATPELDRYLSFPPAARASRESMLDGDEEDRPREEAPVFREGEGDPQDSPGLDPSVIELIESHNEDRRSRQERLALLMQFLMEMDGLRALHGVVVIGATNRPAVLDPAFTRPGRFEKVLCLQLPGKQKRIEILKLYSKNLGLTDAIPSVDVNRSTGGAWEYLANRTDGWSAAHLAAAMNQSAIRAIIEETAHTIETVEHGIGAIARRAFQPSPHPSRQILGEEGATPTNGLETPFLVVSPQLPSSAEGGDPWWTNLFVMLPQAPTGATAQGARLTRHQASQPSPGLTGLTQVRRSAGQVQRNAERDGAFSIGRWAYYQAGKAVLQIALPLHPPAAFLPLRPQPFAKSSSDLSKLLASTAQQGSLEPHRRIVLETRLVGLYAGKAAEMLAFFTSSRASQKSSFQVLDTPLESSTNQKERGEASQATPGLTGFTGTWGSQSDLGIEELTFAGAVANSMITSWYLYSKRVALQRLNLSTIARNVEEIDDPVLLDLLRHLEKDLEHQVERATRHPQRFQQWASPSWWQTQVMAEASLVEPGYSEWYRIYIPDPEETERNIDWVPPEDHYHAPTANRLRNLSRRTPKGAPKSAGSRAPIGPNRSFRRPSMSSLPAITWNDLYLINRDYIYHGLINSCFYKALALLDQRRELLDFLSDHLMRYDLLRQYEIEDVCSNFGLERHSSSEMSTLFNEAPDPRPSDGPERGERGALTELAPITGLSTALKKDATEASPISAPQGSMSLSADRELNPSWESSRGDASPSRSPYVVELGWGVRSRRRTSRFIDFDFVKPCYLKRVS